MKADRPSGSLSSPGQSLMVWWTAIRPRTLSIAATPVVLGSALANAIDNHLANRANANHR